MSASVGDLLAKIESLEERLKSAEARSHVFDVVLSTLPDLICTFDLRGRFTYANPALPGVWQKTLAEIIGRNTLELGYPPDLAARIQGEVQKVITTQRQVINHTSFTGANGETRVYEYIFSPVLSSERSIAEVTCTARDVTDRQRMEKALAESEEKLQQVFAQAPVAIVVPRGPEFVVEMANPFYRALVRGKELVGRPFAEILPEPGQDVWDAFNRVMNTGEPFVASEWYVPYDQNGDGEIEDAWFNVVYHPVRDTDELSGTQDKVTGLVAVCSDVSAQVRARKELESANHELEEFAYVASHDLQEPLRMVGIYTEMLLGHLRANDRDSRQFAGFVRQGVDRMEQLIHDLLAYSKVVHLEEVPAGTADLNRSLSDALRTLAGRIRETNATVIAAPLPLVRGEESQYAQVFQNVISNALKYRNASIAPEIEICAQTDGANCVVSVRDNGIGFEPQYAEKIFGLFKRLYKDEFSGTGLGLAICKRIIERFGGRIWADARPGEGAVFSFSVPCV